MKKTIILLFLCLLPLSKTFAQDNSALPTLSRLISWLNMSFTEFKKDKKVFGFNFEKKETAKDRTDYVYVRRFSRGPMETTERLIYSFNDDSTKGTIALMTIRSSDNDLVIHYETQLAKNNFVTTDCPGEPQKGETLACYQDGEYNFRISSSKIKFYVGDKRKCSAIISQREAPVEK